jgi:iron complex transport system substrate-binding protein
MRLPFLFLVSVPALLCAFAHAQPVATDSDGRSVRLKAPAARIVSLAPHVTELLYAAGAGSRVVGVSEYSDFPAAARDLPRVSSSAGVDLERVLALRPDLVVAWRFEANRGALERLEKLGVPVFFSEPRKLAQIAENLEALGRLAGTEPAAQAAAKALRAELARLQGAYAGRATVRVFYQMSDRPLMTLNGQHLVSSVLALCGADNVFAGAQSIAPAVSAESLLASDPDAIVAARPNPSDTAWQAQWKKRYGSLRAVREGRFASVDSNIMHRHGPRIVAGAAALCERLDELRRQPSAGAGTGATLTAASPR